MHGPTLESRRMGLVGGPTDRSIEVIGGRLGADQWAQVETRRFSRKVGSPGGRFFWESLRPGEISRKKEAPRKQGAMINSAHAPKRRPTDVSPSPSSTGNSSPPGKTPPTMQLRGKRDGIVGPNGGGGGERVRCQQKFLGLVCVWSPWEGDGSQERTAYR